MGSWRDSRMAADFFIDEREIDRASDVVTIEGFQIGGSYAAPIDDDWLFGLPADYAKQFASATPRDLAREPYDPAKVLAPPPARHATGVCDDRYCPKCNAVTERTLQRERKIVLSGGSSKGRTRTKVVPPSGDAPPPADGRELPQTRFTMDSFTPALCAYYRDRQAEARSVIMQLVVYVDTHKSIPERFAQSAFPLPPKAMRKPFEVRGIDVEQKRVLRRLSGISRIALIDHAMNAKDGQLPRLIRKLDGEEVWKLIAA